MSKKNMTTNEEVTRVIRFHRDCILKLVDRIRLDHSLETQNLIHGHLDMIVQLAGAEAKLCDKAQQKIDEIDLEL